MKVAGQRFDYETRRTGTFHGVKIPGCGPSCAYRESESRVSVEEDARRLLRFIQYMPRVKGPGKVRCGVPPERVYDALMFLEKKRFIRVSGGNEKSGVVYQVTERGRDYLGRV